MRSKRIDSANRLTQSVSVPPVLESMLLDVFGIALNICPNEFLRALVSRGRLTVVQSDRDIELLKSGTRRERNEW